MQSIDVRKVIVPGDRQRETFDKRAMEELATSIQKPIGILQPIVLREDGTTLVAGERRLRAAASVYGCLGEDGYPNSEDVNGRCLRHNGEALKPGHIPFVTLDQLTPEELIEAELEENVRRVDLSWQEQAKATAALHEHRLALDPNHTVTATADEINDGVITKAEVNETSELLQLAEFLDDPIISQAKDLPEARKAIKNERKRSKRNALAAAFDPSATPHKLIESSSYETEAEALFDVIITDPPYGIDAHLKDTFDADKHQYDDSDAAFREVCNTLPGLTYRTAKPDAHAYIFCDIRRFNELFVAFELSGWTVWNRPVIWDKGNTGSYGNIERGFRACYEAILFCYKGERKFDAGHRDVINITQKTNHIHPAGKPVELYVELLKRSAMPGDTVGDFYAGGGTIFSAATEFGCTAVGWEIEPDYINLCKARLTEG